MNYLSPFLLTNLLLPILEASAPARILNVNSQVHRSARIDFDDLQSERDYDHMRTYGQAKLANLLFTYGLARRLSGTNVMVNAVDPLGTVKGAKNAPIPGALKLLLDLLASFEGRGGDDSRLGAITDVRRDGLVDPALTPYEMFCLVTAIAMTWSPVNVTYAASRGDGEPEHARRRAAIAEVVSRALVRPVHEDEPGEVVGAENEPTP